MTLKICLNSVFSRKLITPRFGFAHNWVKLIPFFSLTIILTTLLYYKCESLFRKWTKQEKRFTSNNFTPITGRTTHMSCREQFTFRRIYVRLKHDPSSVEGSLNPPSYDIIFLKTEEFSHSAMSVTKIMISPENWTQGRQWK